MNVRKMRCAVKVARKVRSMVVVISSSRCLFVRGASIANFSENGRNPWLSSASPIVELLSSEEFREDIGRYWEALWEA